MGGPKLSDYPYGGIKPINMGEIYGLKFVDTPTNPEDLCDGKFTVNMTLQRTGLNVPAMGVIYQELLGGFVDPRARALAKDVAKSLTLLKTGLPISQLEFREHADRLEVVLTMKLINRDNANDIIGVNFTIVFAWYELLQAHNSRERLLYAIRHLVHDALMHEADECIFFEGVRLNDPHEADGYTRASREPA